jgi:CBS domain-containing protein
MHAGLITCPLGASLGEVAALLVEHRIHSVVVVDAGSAPVGVVSDTDLLAGEWLADGDANLGVLASLTAGELMSAPLLTVDADEPLPAVARRLLEQGVSRLLVRRDGRLAGVVSISDLVGVVGRPGGGRSRVRDAMAFGFVACRAETTVADVARLMAERRTRSVVVLGDGAGVVGVVTARDVVRAVAGEVALDAASAGIATEPVRVDAEAPLGDAAAAMVERETNRLLVVREGDPLPIGTISSWDIVCEMSASAAWRGATGSPTRN